MVFEAQKTYFEISKVKIKQYTSGQGSWLKDVKWELSIAVSRPVVRTDYLNNLLGGWREGTNSVGQVETKPIDAAEIKPPGAYVPAGSKMKSPAADDPAFEEPKIDKPDADTRRTDKLHVLKRGWL